MNLGFVVIDKLYVFNFVDMLGYDKIFLMVVEVVNFCCFKYFDEVWNGEEFWWWSKKFKCCMFYRLSWVVIS